MKLRHPREIAFRLRQEVANAALYVLGPHIDVGTSAGRSGTDLLPDGSAAGQALAESVFAHQVTAIAENVLRGRIPVFDRYIDTGPGIDWQRDYLHNRSAPAKYFRLIPYLDFASAGDHKAVWEINRHQFLISLAQAWRITGREEYLNRIWSLIASWISENPMHRGMNWASALEVAFRALSWMWVWRLAGDRMPRELRQRFLQSLYQHGLHLEYNLSVYFSPNTHLLGEAVALYALSASFPDMPRSPKWKWLAHDMVLEQARTQVRKDGSHFEQSTYYHVYALDFFLLFFVLADNLPDWYTQRLHDMAGYLHALLGPDRSLMFFGDDDGGRLFHPFGDRRLFGRATLATAGRLLNQPQWVFAHEDCHEQSAWWLGPCKAADIPPYAAVRPAHFQDSGMTILTSGRVHGLFDAGPFGSGSAGHSHSDTLSLTVAAEGDEILIDPATFTYVADREARNWFRSSAAHNTVRVACRDQAAMASPFSWAGKPSVEVRQYRQGNTVDVVDAVCTYGEITHRRRIVHQKPNRFLIRDDIDTGSSESVPVEQFWHTPQVVTALSPHLFRLGPEAHLLVSHQATAAPGRRSIVLGSSSPATTVTAVAHASGSLVMYALLDVSKPVAENASALASTVDSALA